MDDADMKELAELRRLECEVRKLRHAQLFSPGDDLGQEAIAVSIIGIDSALADLDSLRREGKL